MLRRGLLAGVIVLMGCGGGARDEAAHRPTGAPAPAIATPPPAASRPAAPTPTPAATLVFSPVVTSGEWIGLHPLLDGSLMISAGPRLLRVDPAGAIDEGPALLAGIELPYPKDVAMGVEAQLERINERGGWSALQVGGTWPGATFLTLETAGRRPNDVYRWSVDRWVKTRPGRAAVQGWPRSVRAWKDRSLLAWRELYVPALDLEDQCSDCPPEMLETPAYKQGERDLAAAKQLVVLAGPAKGPPFAGETIVAFDALTTGEVFVALADGALLVLSPAGERVKVAAPAGEQTVQLHGIVARAADDVIGFGGRDGKAYLVRHDGAKQVALDAPACAPGIASLSIAGDVWWATCAEPPPRSYEQLSVQDRAGSLWRREGAGAWQRVALGEGVEARLVVARAADDVWVAAYGEHGGTALHSREHGRVIALGDLLGIVREGFFAGRG